MPIAMLHAPFEQLPVIAAEGRRRARRILEDCTRRRVALKSCERVRPARAPAIENSGTNRLIHGDELPALAALIAGDDTTPGLRGRVDLIVAAMPPATSPSVDAAAEIEWWTALAARLTLLCILLREGGTLWPCAPRRMQRPLRLMLDALHADKRCGECLRERAPPASWLGRLTDADGLVLAVGDTASIAAAERLGRRWIGLYRDRAACLPALEYLVGHGSLPFVRQTTAEPPIVPPRHGAYRNRRADELAMRALLLFGAEPLLADPDVPSHCGRLATNAAETLVWVDSPYRRTGAETLRAAIARRDDPALGWSKTVVLGWEFEPDIGATIAALADPQLEVRAIPGELRGRLLRRGDARPWRGQKHFPGLSHLAVHPVSCTRRGKFDHLTVRLAGYMLFSPDALDRLAQLHAALRADPLALIDYWAVDPACGGEPFRADWQACRGDAQRVAAEANIVVPHATGGRRVGVRAIDVFGHEVEVVLAVAETTSSRRESPV